MQRVTVSIVVLFLLTVLAPLAVPQTELSTSLISPMQSPLSHVSTFSEATQQWMLDNQENNGENDNDGDNSRDDTDRDDDNDCIPDFYDTSPVDFDNDGIDDHEDDDDDGDGILDETEASDNDPLTNLYDSDNDGSHDCITMTNFYFDMIDVALTVESDHTLHHNTSSYNLIVGEDFTIQVILFRANQTAVTFGGPDGLHLVESINHTFQASADTENRTGSYENLSHGYYCMQVLLHTPLHSQSLDFTPHYCRTLGDPPSDADDGGAGDSDGGTGSGNGTGNGDATDDGNNTEETGNGTDSPEFDGNVTYGCIEGNITVTAHFNATGLTVDQLQLDWQVSISTTPNDVLDSGSLSINALEDGNFSFTHEFSFAPPEQNSTYLLTLDPTSSLPDGLLADAPYLYTLTVNCTTENPGEGDQDDTGGTSDGDSPPGGDGPDVVTGTGPTDGNETATSDEPTPGFGLPMALCALLFAAGFARREQD